MPKIEPKSAEKRARFIFGFGFLGFCRNFNIIAKVVLAIFRWALCVQCALSYHKSIYSMDVAPFMAFLFFLFFLEENNST